MKYLVFKKNGEVVSVAQKEDAEDKNFKSTLWLHFDGDAEYITEEEYLKLKADLDKSHTSNQNQ